jgi:hypothetical protein
MSYTLVPTELIVDGAITSAKLDTNIAISGTLGVTGEVTLATHLIMGDNDKIKIGTGGDLEIYHDGSNSYISNSTGNIYLADTNGAVHIQAKLNEESIVASADGAVTLYHDNAVKLATSSAGVSVTGTLTATTLAGTLSTAAQPNITSVGTLTSFRSTGIDDNADALAITIDSSEKIAIGTATTVGKLTVEDDSTIAVVATTDASTNAYYVSIGGSTSDTAGVITAGSGSAGNSVPLIFQTASSGTEAERMRLTSTGLGIGTGASIDAPLHIQYTGTGSGLVLESTEAGASNAPDLVLYRNSSSPADSDDIGNILFRGKDDAGNDNSYAFIMAEIGDASNGSEDGNLFFRTQSGGSLDNRLSIVSNNIGIGTDSPARALEINSGSSPIIESVASGSNNSSLRLRGSLSSGHYWDIQHVHGDNDLSFGWSGSERVRFTATGSVGIGKTSPAFILDVESADDGLARFTSTDANAYITIGDVNSTSAHNRIGVTTHDMWFNTNGSERVRIDSSGLVGIGQTPSSSDGSMLQITGADGIQLKRSGQTNGFVIRPNASTDGIRFTQGGTGDRMTIDSSGNVGIGNTSPTEKLAVHGAIQSSSTGNFNGGTEGVFIDYNSSTGIGKIQSASWGSAYKTLDLQAVTHVFSTGSGSAAERMRIDSSGNVGVGTTSATGKFEVQASAVSGGVVKIQDTDSTVSLSNTLLGLYFPNDNDCTSATFLGMYDSGSRIGSITVTNATSVAFNTTSDERLKENIVDASSKLELVKDIQVREFDWKKDGRHQVGFIAQELNNLVPEAVTEGGEDVTENPWGVDYGKLTPYLIKAVQEQQTIIEDLKSRIETLEG